MGHQNPRAGETRECVLQTLRHGNGGRLVGMDGGAQLRPYAEIVIEAFGPARTMFRSDWPVCLVATQYARWVKVVQKFLSSLSENEQALVFGSASVIAYGLQIPQQSMPFKA